MRVLASRQHRRHADVAPSLAAPQYHLPLPSTRRGQQLSQSNVATADTQVPDQSRHEVGQDAAYNAPAAVPGLAVDTQVPRGHESSDRRRRVLHHPQDLGRRDDAAGRRRRVQRRVLVSDPEIH